jgi:hypothetical protein
MSKLKLGAIADEKPVKVTVEIAAGVWRDLAAYAQALGRETGEAVTPARLVSPMLARFMATDRAFASARRRPPGLPEQPASASPVGLNSENA